jgi:chemotaxis response regulator CheB
MRREAPLCLQLEKIPSRSFRTAISVECAVRAKCAEAFAPKEAIMTPEIRKGRAKGSKSAAVSAASDVQDGAGGPGNFPIVGIGASAGGLAAIEAFFAAMPRDKTIGVAFVLVQHLSPITRAS